MTDIKRIEFIDLAKGICILLVVLLHIGIDVNFWGTTSMRMPLYFVLSGLFFKDYGSLYNLLIKKTNRLIIPFLFFYLLGYAVYYGVNLVVYPRPIYGVFDAEMIFSLFMPQRRVYFNGPIWFLLSLFWANLLFGIISLKVKKEAWRAVIVVLLGTLGYFLGQYRIFLPFMADIAFSALPYFYLGYILRKSPLLYPNAYDKYNLLIALGLYVVAAAIDYFFACPRIWFHFNIYYGNAILAFLLSATSVGAVLFLCKAVGKLPIISYIGRYSIIFLGFHHLVFRHLFFIFDETVIRDKWIVAGLTILICLITIPVCKKYIPWFVAQKDLIH